MKTLLLILWKHIGVIIWKMKCFFIFLQNLQVGDELIRFGSVQERNFENLQDVGKVVQHSIGVSLIFLYFEPISSVF